MKRMTIALFALASLMVALTACNSGKRDAAYYERMVDSIRKAETVKDMYRKSASKSNPLEAFFDTLARCALPISSVRAEYWRMGHFSNLPSELCVRFGFTADSRMLAQSLPHVQNAQLLMLVDRTDSTSTSLYLCTLNKSHEMIDQLCIYDEEVTNREHDFGVTLTDYFITSDHEVTLMRYYQSHDKKRDPQLLNVRLYQITADGFFEEQIIEL